MGRYLIGDILLEMDFGEIPVDDSGNLALFRNEAPWCGESLELPWRVESIGKYTSNPVYEDNGVFIGCRVNNEHLLVYHWGKLLHGFGIWPEKFSCIFDPRMYEQVPLNLDWFFGVCGFHRQLLMRDMPILHASYIDFRGKAILFSAASQTGKSTQASLWNQYVGAEIINGDRALLRRNGEGWHVYGYPCCGSSNICVNRTLSIGAIVILEQGSVNQVVQMPPGQKIRTLAAAMEFYYWDAYEMNMVFDLASKIAGTVPVIRLICRPDGDAVRVLKDYLTGEGILHAD